jgi:GAF domain-containing protein
MSEETLLPSEPTLDEVGEETAEAAAAAALEAAGHGGAPVIPGVAAEVPLATLLVSPDGRVAHWSRTAEEIFGHRWGEAVGRPAAGLLPLPRGSAAKERDADALERLAELASVRGAWAGVLPFTDRSGRPRAAFCWAYELRDEPQGRLSPDPVRPRAKERGLLVLAADARLLRAEGPRLVVGPRALPFGGLIGAQRPHLEAALGLGRRRAVPDASVRAAFGGLLPGAAGDARRERLLTRLTSAGLPLLVLDGEIRLPVRPMAAESPSYGSAADARDAKADGPFNGPPPTPTLVLSHGGAVLPPANEQLRLLNEVGSRVGTTLELDRTVRELCEVVAPEIADVAWVDLRDSLLGDDEPEDEPGAIGAETVLRRVARRLPSARRDAWLPPLREGRRVVIPQGTAPGMAMQSNQPVLVPVICDDLAEELADAFGGEELAELLDGRSMLVLPLVARGTVLGCLTLLRGADRPPFDEVDASYLRELAARAALSVDNARLHRREARAASVLQRSMLPTSPPLIPGVQIAHRYLPGDRRAEVGGDWFDAVRLPGSRVALMVGDVMGHGLQSAAAMGRFRTAMQTLAALDLPPAQILRHLDNLSQRLGDNHLLATCLYAVYDPIGRTCALASAGHVPPVLVHPDGRGELLDIPSGAPIGVGGVPFETKEIAVTDGSMLVLCTDGLVEMRGGDIGDGLAALCANVVDPTRPPEEVCDTVLQRLHTDDRKDDLALLVARFDGIAADQVQGWALHLDAAEVPRARRLVARQLANWGLAELSETTQLLVSELVTNALRVAKDTIWLQLTRVDRLLVEVQDDDHNLPSLEASKPTDARGRGLGLVSQLSARWGTSRRAVGKVVWFELPLPRQRARKVV